MDCVLTTVGRAESSFIQELRNLRCFATAGLTADDDDWVQQDGLHNRLLLGHYGECQPCFLY